MPIPVIEFAAQRSVEVTDIGVNSSTDALGCDSMTASVSATLWRKPEDKSDPANLADLDDKTRRSLEEVPPWPRPAWLIERVESMKYPMLWEAVQTSWHRDESELADLDNLLVQHANYILMNQFREEPGLDVHDWDSPALTSKRMIRAGIDVTIDGESVTGAEIDTDPFVYAIGAKLANGGTLTAVIAREHLPFIRLGFARR
ncbi:hypothetical protein [Rhodoglobus vestalii]|nr:hypothetical protein [Rhodoglobus vestalii]